MRNPRPLPATLLGLLLFGVSAGAAPGDEAAEAIRRFKDGWAAGLEGLPAAEVEAKRAPLLEPVAAAGTYEAFDAVLVVARERTSQVAQFRKRLKKLDEMAKEEAADEKSGKKPDPAPEPPARGQVDPKVQAEKDRREIPPRLERELAWQPRLAAAAGALVDGLTDAEFNKNVSVRLSNALGDRCEGWDAWLVDAIGRSKKERTVRAVLDAAADSLKDYRKALLARAGPAKDLDDINDKINKILLPYLEKQQKNGDFSGSYPQNLVPDALTKDQARLEAVLNPINTAIDEADLRRLAARGILGAMLAGAAEDVRGKLFDFVEKEALGQKDFETRVFGLGAIGPCPGDRAMKALRTAAKDPSPEVVVAALQALGTRTEAEAIEILSASLADARWQVRGAAVAGLAASGRAAAVPPLLAALAKAEGRSIDDIAEALVRLTGRKFPPVAAAWEAWWKEAGPNFRGPKDPGGATAGGGGPAEGPAPPAADDGNLISFYGIETRTNRPLFVLDFSGSMNFIGSEAIKNRKKIDILYEEIKRTISGLPEGAKFNIIGFSSDVRVWKKGGATRDGKTAKEAVEWILKQPVVGSTNIYDAFETTFKMMGVGASVDKAYAPAYDTIFFMTDGVPTSGKVTDKDKILGEVRRWNEGRKIRIHVVGMGGKDKGAHAGPKDDIDKDFLTKLAEENDGQVVFR